MANFARMTGMQSDEAWAENMAKQLARGLEMFRNGRSDQSIADRTSALGHPMSRTAISEYRRGKRKIVPITDLLVLAAALEVAPAELLFPTYPVEKINYLPGREAAGSAVMAWLVGENTLGSEGLSDRRSTIRDLVAQRSSWQLGLNLTGLANRFSQEGDEEKARWIDDLIQQRFDESQRADVKITNLFRE